MIKMEQLISEQSTAITKNNLPLLTKEISFLKWLNGNFFKEHKEICAFLNEEISGKCTEIFWSVASLQISLGDFLIIEESNTKEFEGLNDLLMQQRVNIVYEQLYRIWERYTGLLGCVFKVFQMTKNLLKRLYINNGVAGCPDLSLMTGCGVS